MDKKPSSAPTGPASPPLARDSREEVLLEASRHIIKLFLDAGTSDFSVKEMAECSGLSERTFYRYFPRKDLVLKPHIAWALEQMISDIRSYPPSRPLQEALVAAHVNAYKEGSDQNWAGLLPMLNEKESLRAMWLQVLTEAEASLAQVIQERLGLPVISLRATLMSAVVVAAGRLALEQSIRTQPKGDPIELFSECLEILGEPLFGLPTS